MPGQAVGDNISFEADFSSALRECVATHDGEHLADLDQGREYRISGWFLNYERTTPVIQCMRRKGGSPCRPLYTLRSLSREKIQTEILPKSVNLLVFGIAREGAEPATWLLETTSPGRLVRLGWMRTSLKPGDRVQAEIHPLRDGQRRGGSLQKITSIATGKSFATNLREQDNLDHE